MQGTLIYTHKRAHTHIVRLIYAIRWQRKQTHKTNAEHVVVTRYIFKHMPRTQPKQANRIYSEKYANIVWKTIGEHSTYSHQIEAELLATYIF